MLSTMAPLEIREVWKENMEEEFALIASIIDEYPYVAMDTEFPGAVLASLARSESKYKSIKANADMMHLIQLGMTLSDEEGNLPLGNSIWQFNFCEFDPDCHPHAEDSIDLLRNSGIDFQSSYDLAYLLSILNDKQPLPQTLIEFKTLIRKFFPVLFDVKHLIKYCEGLYGGLDRLGYTLGVQRYGNSHLAGSDSHLTLSVFLRLKRFYFHGVPYDYEGVVFGLE
ncbi:hypothetical protein LUZ60_002942 [Juncus effusus]|nr:hypothetical protein LUZ60_002942 [Juncus effusus]